MSISLVIVTTQGEQTHVSTQIKGGTSFVDTEARGPPLNKATSFLEGKALGGFSRVNIDGGSFLRFYLFIHERYRERDRDIGRGRSRLHGGSRTWDSILGLQDHALGRRRR